MGVPESGLARSKIGQSVRNPLQLLPGQGVSASVSRRNTALHQDTPGPWLTAIEGDDGTVIDEPAWRHASQAAEERGAKGTNSCEP